MNLQLKLKELQDALDHWSAQLQTAAVNIQRLEGALAVVKQLVEEEDASIPKSE